MRGGTMSGNCSMGRPNSAISPPRTVTIERTMETMVRLIKKRAMGFLPRSRGAGRRRLTRRDGHARLHAGKPFDDDAIAGLQTLIDEPKAAELRTDLHGPDLCLVALADDGDLISPLHLVDGALEHEDRAAPDLRDRADLRVLTGAEAVAGVGKDSDGGDRAGLHVDVTPGEQHAALLREG